METYGGLSYNKSYGDSQNSCECTELIDDAIFLRVSTELDATLPRQRFSKIYYEHFCGSQVPILVRHIHANIKAPG